MRNLLGLKAHHTFSLFLLAIALPLLSQDQPPAPATSAIDEALQGMKDDKWEVRSKAFYNLIRLGAGSIAYVQLPLEDLLKRSPNRAAGIKISLIHLLEKENQLVQHSEKTRGRLTEAYTNYYGDVIVAVVTLKDIRSMNALLGAISTGWMAVRTLAEFAPASLYPVLAKLNDKDPLVRSSALGVLQEMLSPPNYDKVKQPESRHKIKQAFLSGTRDENAIVRAAAVRGLAALGDPDVIPIVEELAQHDPDYLPRQGEGGSNLYYVRNQARRALIELRSKAQEQQSKHPR